MAAPPEPVAPSRENVINLNALKRSIAAQLPPKKPAAASKGASVKRRNPRRRTTDADGFCRAGDAHHVMK